MIAASEVRFKTEDEFERFVIGAPEILPGVFILKRQVRGGKDIPDVVGIDPENFAVIIENKNVPVDEKILSQIMRYAVWADTHQEAFRAWWAEAKDRPDDIEVDWDHLQIRVIVLAPSIKPIVLRLVKKLGYPFDLVEIKRFHIAKEEIILVNRLEPTEDEEGGPTKAKQVYDKEFYMTRRNPTSVVTFFKLEADLQKVVRQKGWQLDAKFNSYYAGFNHGFFVAFGVAWTGTKSLEVFAKIPKNLAARAKKLCPYPSEYDERGKRLNIPVTSDLKPKQLTPLLQFAYNSLVGDHAGV